MARDPRAVLIVIGITDVALSDLNEWHNRAHEALVCARNYAREIRAATPGNVTNVTRIADARRKWEQAAHAAMLAEAKWVESEHAVNEAILGALSSDESK